MPPITVPKGAGRELLEGRIPVFCQWIPWHENDAFWHTDPITGAVWPHAGGQQPDYRPGNAVGDARTIWELNRLQHLVSLAVLARQNSEAQADATRLISRQVAAWTRANPFPDGVNHASAMEEALRVLALMHTIDLARDSLDMPAREDIARILQTHGWHIERKLSLFSSAGNHTIAEAVGLLYLGVLLPEHPRAGKWTATARRLLDVESARQVRADGGPLEQATWYLLFITDLMGLAQLLLAHTGLPSITAMDAAVSRSRAFLGKLASCPDDLPRIGDADDGYALSPHLNLSWPVAPRKPVRTLLPDTGITVASFGDNDQLLFLHKDLGMAPNFGHGHSDALSVVFRWRDQPALLDPGTYLYGGPTGMRSYFRSAFGHNTVTIGGADALVQKGPFLWRSGYRSRVIFSKLDNDLAAVLALCDNYGRQGFTHWRGILYRRDRYLAVLDLVQGNAVASGVTVRWHVGGTPTPNKDGSVQLTLPSGDDILIRLPTGKTSISKGSSDPVRGWRSAHYTQLEPCNVIECVLPDSQATEALTVFELANAPVPGNELHAWIADCRDRSRQVGSKS